MILVGNPDGRWKVGRGIDLFLASQCVTCNGFKGFLDVHALLRRRFEVRRVGFLYEKNSRDQHGQMVDLVNYLRTSFVLYGLESTIEEDSERANRTCRGQRTYHAILQIDLVSDDLNIETWTHHRASVTGDTYDKRKVLWIARAGLLER